jgi:hypothetical protein
MKFRRVVGAALALSFAVLGVRESAAQQQIFKKMDEDEIARKKAAEEEAKKKAIAEELKKKGPPKVLPDGWHPFLGLGSSVQIGSSSNVVGRIDGQTYSIGANVNGRMNYKKGKHEWNNRLAFQIQQTNTPGLTGWVKSLDLLRIESNYVWSPSANFGVYAGLLVDTSVFGTEDVRSLPTTYLIKEPGGRFSGDFGGGSLTPGGPIRQVLLTKEFAPATIGPGAGANIKLYEAYGHKVQGRVGIGSQTVFGRNGIALTDDPLTPTVVEATRLQDFTQIGASTRVSADGAILKNVTYGLLVEFLFPFYNSIDTSNSFINTINMSLDLKLGLKVNKWFSVEYVLGVRRQPLLVDKFQVWHGLLASFAVNVIE